VSYFITDGISVNTRAGTPTTGGLTLSINPDTVDTETSDFQLASLYIWDKSLSDADFTAASVMLNNYRAGTDQCPTASTQCPANSYGTGGVIPCTLCATGFSSSAGATTCTSNCPTNAAYVANTITCVCNAGFFLSGGVCTVCLAGSSKAVAGDDACECNAGHTIYIYIYMRKPSWGCSDWVE